MSLADYQSLDLRIDGPLGQDLAARVDVEASQPVLALSAPHAANVESPAFLTAGMRSWYLAHISSARQSALSEVRLAFEQEPLGSGNKGFLLEAEKDAIEQRKQAHLKAERQSFFQRKEVSDLMLEIERLKTEYERKRSSYGRDATAWRPGLYFFGLFLFVMAEYPVNLSAFLKIDFLTPAFATISVTLIAFGLAFSSHLIGLVVRQWSERFGENVVWRLKAESWRLLGTGVLLLVIGGAAIVFSRSYLVADALARAESLGENAPSAVSIYGLALIMNVFVYSIGLAWSIVFHDSVPDFLEERYRFDKLRAVLRKRYRTLLESKQRQRIEEARRAVQEAERRSADQIKSLKNYGIYRTRFEEVRKLDAKVLALFENYRSRLLTAARKQGLQTRFVYDDLTSGDVETKREFDGQGYMAQSIYLGYV